MVRQMNQMLIISGLDSTSSAGILLDSHIAKNLKVQPICILSSITVQNSHKVSGSFFNKDALITQLEAIKLPPKFAKIGLLQNSQAIKIVAKFLQKHQIQAIADTPIIASSGYSLVEDIAKYTATFKKHLLPQTILLTPNATELEHFGTIAEILQTNCKAVLLKGGHLKGDICTDFLHTNSNIREFSSPRLRFQENIRGTGCGLSTAIACFLTQGLAMQQAITQAKSLIFNAIQNSIKVDKKTRILHFQSIPSSAISV